MPLMSYEYDQEAEELFEELKELFGVKTKSAVIRRSLALAKIAKRKADKNKTVVMGTGPEDSRPETISLAS